MKTLRVALGAWLLAVSSATVVRADEIKLRDGSVIVGEITRETPLEVEVQGKFGSTTIKKKKVASIHAVPTPEAAYRERRAALVAGDVAGRLELAESCRTSGLLDHAEDLAREAFALEPKSTAARDELEKLDLHFVAGLWIPASQRYPAHGFARQGNRWLTPEQAQALAEAAAAGQTAIAKTAAEARGASARARVVSLDADLAVLARELQAARAQVAAEERCVSDAEGHEERVDKAVNAAIDPCVGITAAQQAELADAARAVRSAQRTLATAQGKVDALEARQSDKESDLATQQAKVDEASEALALADSAATVAARAQLAAADRAADASLAAARSDEHAALEAWLGAAH